jgi:hypothetical protein
MSEEKSNWVRNLLFIPLLVGILVAFFTFLVPKLFENKNELSYSLDGPTTYIDPNTVSGIKVEIEGVPSSSLVAYRVRVWNSGSSPLKNVPVLFAFKPSDSTFKIFSITHSTNPQLEFGKITKDSIDFSARRFHFELLNPGDEDTVTFLTNQTPPISLFAKAEGLTVNFVKPRESTSWLQIIIVVVAAISSLLSIAVSMFRRRKSQNAA